MMNNQSIKSAKEFLDQEYVVTVQRLRSDNLAQMAGGSYSSAEHEWKKKESALRQQGNFQLSIIDRKNQVVLNDLERLVASLEAAESNVETLSKKDNESIRNYLSILMSKTVEEKDAEKEAFAANLEQKIAREKQDFNDRLLAQAAAKEKELKSFVGQGRDRLSVLDAFFETAPLSSSIYTSLNSPSNYQGFPLLNHVCVGKKSICIPVHGKEDIEFNVPEIIPFFTKNSLTLQYKAGQRKAANLVLDQIFIRSLCCLNTNHVSISFLAPGNKGDLFVNYLDLSELAKRIYNDSVLTTFEEIMPLLDTVIAESKKTYQTKSLGERIDLYNENHKEKIPYRIIFLDATSKELPPPMLDRLIQLADDVCYSGIHLVIVTEESTTQLPLFDRLLSRTYVYTIPDDMKQPEDLISEILKRTKDKVNSQYGQVQGFNFEDYYGKIDMWKDHCPNITQIPIGVVNSNNFDIVYNEEGVKGPASAHTMMLGGTGSGKTTFLHAFIVGLALKYSPAEIRFILVDLKGTGFQDYALYKLPHADMVAYSGSAELGVHTLALAVKKMQERGSLFNSHNVETYKEFREKYPNEELPRYFIIIDEYQSMFKNPDCRAQARSYISTITEKARTYGINLLLASQSCPLGREVLNNFTTKIVLKCEQADTARMLLGSGNRYSDEVPHLLYESLIVMASRTYKTKFYYLKPDQRRKYLEQISAKTEEEMFTEHRMLVFDGKAGAYLSNNVAYKKLKPQPILRVVEFSPGEKVLVDGNDLMRTLERTKGNNIYVTGGNLNPSVRALYGCLTSMLPQFETGSESGVVFDMFNFMNPLEESKEILDKNLKSIADSYPGSKVGDDSTMEKILDEAYSALKERKEHKEIYYPPRFIVMFQMDKSKELSPVTVRQSIGDTETVSPALKELSELLKSGPEYGIHCLLHTYDIEGLKSLCCKKQEELVLAHVKHRVLLQMNDDESKQLMKGRNASNLTDVDNMELDETSRMNRAIYYDTNTPNIKNTIIKPYEFEITPQEEQPIK